MRTISKNRTDAIGAPYDYVQIFKEVELTEAEKDRVQDEKPNGKQAEGILARDNMYSFTLLNTQLIEKLENILIKMQPIEVQCKRLLF